MIAGEMLVGKPRNPPEIFLIHVPQDAPDLQRVGRVPDIVEDSGEVRRIIGEAELVGAAISRLQTESMSHAITSEVAVATIGKIGVTARDASQREKVMYPGAGAGVEVPANQERDLISR